MKDENIQYENSLSKTRWFYITLKKKILIAVGGRISDWRKVSQVSNLASGISRV